MHPNYYKYIMNKALYIVGIVFAIIFTFVIGYYAAEVASARLDYLFSDFSSYGSSYYDSYSSGSEYKDLTFTASLWSLFFIASFIAIDLMGLLNVKTKTAKVFSIIGLSISGIFLFWNFAVMFSDGGITFDEIAGAYIFYCLIMLAFCIIGLVQAVRFGKMNFQPAEVKVANEDILDN